MLCLALGQFKPMWELSIGLEGGRCIYIYIYIYTYIYIYYNYRCTFLIVYYIYTYIYIFSVYRYIVDIIFRLKLEEALLLRVV